MIPSNFLPPFTLSHFGSLAALCATYHGVAGIFRQFEKIFAFTSRTSGHAHPTNLARRPLSATQAASVAEIVGIPENTVKTRLFYARKKLADLLKAAGAERGWP
jgi:hypothetical protein